MTDVVHRIRVQLRREKGLEEYEIDIPAESPVLSDAFAVVSGLVWGSSVLEEQDEGLRARAGVLVVLNNRMIQAWDVETTRVQNGDQLRFVPVVAGG